MQISGRGMQRIVLIVFVLIFIAGALLYDDYGVSVDEPTELWTTRYNYDLIKTTLRIGGGVERDPGFDEYLIKQFSLKYYGVALQLPTLFLESALRRVGIPLTERDHYLLRHFYTFCCFYLALICFYFLLRNLFGDRLLALTGVLMLLLFGRVFAQSFYNIKDMLFLSVFVWLFFVTERVFTTGRSVRWCLLYAFVAALVVNVRIIGALWILLTISAMLTQDIALRRKEARAGDAARPHSLLRALRPYALICLSYPCWLLITPCAWAAPMQYTLEAITVFMNYVTFQGAVLYNGQEIASSQLPSAYVICWIGMTVPLVNTALCLLGMGAYAGTAVSGWGSRPCAQARGRATLALLLAMLAVTLGYQMIRRPVIYNGWRHMFFLYPIIVVFAVYGLAFLLELASQKRSALLRVGAIAAVAGSLAFNAAHIAWAHPYEYATYNVIGMRTAKRFDRDYWKLSNRQAFRYLLDTVEGDIGLVCLDGPFEPFLTGEQFFPDAERARLVFAGSLAEAEYAVVNCRWLVDTNEVTLPGFAEVFDVSVDGVKLCSVQKRVAREPS